MSDKRGADDAIPPEEPLDIDATAPSDARPLDHNIDLATAKSRAVYGAGATIVAQAVKFVLKFGSGVALARLLDPAQFGIVAMVGPIIIFVSTLNDLGFAQAVVQRRDITAEQISRLFWINVAVSVALAAVVMLSAPLVGWLYGEPRTIGITMVLAAMIVVGTIGIVPTALLNRQMRFIPIVLIDIAQLFVSVTVSIGLAWYGFGYWSLVLAQVVATTFGILCTLRVAKWRPLGPRQKADVGPLVKFGVNLTGVNLATYFSRSADNMIVGVVGGKVQLGLYDRSYSLVLQPLSQLMAPLGRVAIPLLSRVNDDAARFRTTYIQMLRLGALLTAPLMICCTILAGPLIVFLLGAKWTAAAPVFAFVSFGGIFASAFYSTGWVFTTEGRTPQQLRLSVVTALISVASFAAGIPWGAAGVAGVNALTFSFLQVPIMLYGMTREGAIRPGDVVRAMMPLLIASAATAAMVYLLRGVGAPGIVFFGIMFTLAYALFAAIVLLLPGGRDLLSALWNLKSSLRRKAAA